MENLIAACDRLTAKMNDHETRVNKAKESAIALEKTLQEEKDAMNTAAAADDVDAYLAHDARVRFLTSRIEATKKAQGEKLHATQADAIADHNEISSAICQALRPIYARLQETMNEQDAIYEELRNIANISNPVSYRLSQYAIDTRYSFSPWDIPNSIRKFIREGRYDVKQTIDGLLSK